jgi:uncharacterized protein (TIGR03546 family)
MFSQLIKFIQVLSSETAPIQISSGFALAMIVGLTPLFSVHNILVIFCLLLFRINLAAFLLGWVFFSGLAYLLDPLFHDLGRAVLTHEALNALWTELYNQPFWRIAGFNNTIVMGSLLASLLAFIPLLLISNLLIKHYRSDVMIYVQNSRIFRFLKSSKLFSRVVSLAE